MNRHSRLREVVASLWLRGAHSGGGGVALGVAIASALCVPLAFFAMFSGFRAYDDEGYLLVTLRYYARGAVLYDQLYAKYGPAYFQGVTTLFSALNLSYTHMNGRALALGMWVATALAASLATYRLTRNAAVTFAAHLVLFPVLIPMRNEPPHPGGMAALLVAGVVVAATFLERTPRPRVAATMGALTAIATLTKINVGLLALVSVAFALLAVAPASRARRVLRVMTGLAFLSAGPVLMVSLVTVPWVYSLLMVIVGTGIAIVVTQRGWPGQSEGAVRDFLTLVVAFAITVLASCGWEYWRGTSIAGLVHGILLDPIQHPVDNTWPLDISPRASWWTLTMLGLALFFAVARHRGWTERYPGHALRGLVQILAGLAIWLVATETLPLNPLAASLPLLWIALASPPAVAGPDREAGRVVLVATAALQALHAYPVAGSQVAWATFLFVPVGALSIADGWRAVASLYGATPPVGLFRRWAPALTLATLLVAFAASSLYAAQRQFWSTYRAGVPLGLPGAEGIRVSPRPAAVLRYLSSRLTEHCATFVTWPGLDSLYIFTRLEPPTMLSTVAGMTSLPEVQQADLVARLGEVPGPLCAVTRVPPGPVNSRLGAYLEDEFRTLFTLDGFALKITRRPGDTS
jgi:hypothetical protein